MVGWIGLIWGLDWRLGLRLDLGIWSGLGFFWIRDSLKGFGASSVGLGFG